MIECHHMNITDFYEQHPSFIGPVLIRQPNHQTWALMFVNKGTLHREDGPAVIYQNGTLHWYVNNIRHRIDGPATIWWNGCRNMLLMVLHYQKIFL